MGLLSDADYDAAIATTGGGDTVSIGLAATSVVYSGVGNGTITGLVLGAGAVSESITLLCVNEPAQAFDVIGSVTGEIDTIAVGASFVSPQLALRIVAGSIPFVLDDLFTITIGPAPGIPCQFSGADVAELERPPVRGSWSSPVGAVARAVTCTIRTSAAPTLQNGATVLMRGGTYRVDHVMRLRDESLTRFAAYLVS